MVLAPPLPAGVLLLLVLVLQGGASVFIKLAVITISETAASLRGTAAGSRQRALRGAALRAPRDERRWNAACGAKHQQALRGGASISRLVALVAAQPE